MNNKIKILVVSGAIIIIFPFTVGIFTNPNNVNAARGYANEAKTALSKFKTDNAKNGSSNDDNTNAQPAESTNDNKPEKQAANQVRQLTKSYVAIGSGSNPDDEAEVKKDLLVNKDTETLITNGQDVKTYTGVDATDAATISSASIMPGPKDSGINVKIVKFNGQNNITQITAAQYAMVAQMAGLNDVVITVTADKPVSGHGALAGLYKALAADGIPVSTENSTVANSMLGATSDAIDAQPDDKKDDYAQKLSGAVLQASANLNKDGSNAMDELNKALDEAGIQMSQSDKEAIAADLQKFASTPVAKSDDYKNNIEVTQKALLSGNYTKDADKYLGKLTGYGQNAFQKTGNVYARGWKEIGNWFESVWSWISTAGKGKVTEFSNVNSSSDNNNDSNNSSESVTESSK